MTLDDCRPELLSGFGQTEFLPSEVARPRSLEEVKQILADSRTNGRRVVLRGAGCSYGDAAIARDAIVLDITEFRAIRSLDSDTGVIDCEPGTTVEDVWRRALPFGWWPPVVSGTMIPTLAGAVAMNIHGKNAFRVGTVGEHVLELDVLTTDGRLITLTPSDSLFFAVIGGAGLLGVIVRIRLQLKKVESGNLRVHETAPRNWRAQIEAFEKHERDADYMVGWIDCFARGDASGRGQFHAAWHIHESDAESLLPHKQDLPTSLAGVLPKSSVWRILKPLNNRLGMRALNAAKDFAGRAFGSDKTFVQSLVGYSFLLDYVPNWRNAYRPSGFIQYQSFVPRAHAEAVFTKQMELQQAAGLESFLGVMKLHRPDPFLISHDLDGFSLALDFKVTRANRERLWALCHDMNDLVLEAGGRFYFAKDSTLRPQDVVSMLGEGALAALRADKSQLDPDGMLTSALAERLELFPG